ncbi:hypothetical protein [Geobacter sp.]|uniref:hypothetical protein n=1 Tax=Geobacter sp. TaxID=46610 RepID=UPI0026227B0E|nr:hypothetical protein [Geobacter sp.]
MSCGECRYLGWLGLVIHCRHPEHPKPIRKWPGKCGDFVDWERKVMPGAPLPWPEPVDLGAIKEELKHG